MWRNKHYKQYYGYYKRDKRNLIKFGIVFAVLFITMYFMHFIKSYQFLTLSLHSLVSLEGVILLMSWIIRDSMRL